jgi:hypothetical protein
MSLDVTVTQEACCSRVLLQGVSSLGRLMSLVQVLEIDSRTWPHDAVLFDLRQLQTRFSDEEQARFAWEVGQVLRRMKKIAVLAEPGRMREAAGVRVFEDDAAALRWLVG